MNGRRSGMPDGQDENAEAGMKPIRLRNSPYHRVGSNPVTDKPISEVINFVA